MKYELIDLVDINQLQKLLNSFYSATGIASGIVSRDGKILTSTCWKSICTKFHRATPETNIRCIESDTFLLNQLKSNNAIVNHKCKNGIIDIGTPIIVEGDLLAIVFSGQIFFEKPDIEYFRRQAKEFGFEEESYLKALEEVPIVNKDKHEKVVLFLKDLAEVISEMGLRQLKILDIQKKLKLSDERFRLALYGSNDGIWNLNLKDNTYYVSDRFLQITGYKKTELEHFFSDYVELIHPEDINNFTTEFHKHLIKGHNSHLRQEVRIKTKFGNYKWVLIRGAAIFNNENIPVKMAGSLTDISHRKAIEELLKTEQAFSKAIIDHANVMICTWAPDGRLIQFNKYGEQLTGFSFEELCSLNGMKVLFKEDLRETAINYIPSMDSDLVNTPIEKSFYNKQGALITILWNNQLIKNEDGSIKYIVGIGIDITQRKNEEKSLTEFFANISHELKTPLNTIFCSLQLIDLYSKNNSANGNGNQLMNCKKSIKQNCYRLLRLVNNLIDITKIDAGFYELSMEEYDIVNLIENICFSVVPYAQGKGIELIFDTDVEEKYIYCDGEKIERIILNLLSNAIKFNNSPGNIYVTLEDISDGISISIKDTGIGIEEDKLIAIFERFKQVNKSFTREQEGSGIGLSLVKALVELHNGSIEVKSSYGKGSEFIIKLPSSNDNFSEKAVIPKAKCMNEYSNVEKINIEFSDIYF